VKHPEYKLKLTEEKIQETYEKVRHLTNIPIKLQCDILFVIKELQEKNAELKEALSGMIEAFREDDIDNEIMKISEDFLDKLDEVQEWPEGLEGEK